MLANDKGLARVRGPYGFTALHLLATEDHDAVVRLLLAAGANPNARGDGGTMPLHAASSGAFVRLLCQNGANPNLADDAGNTSLHALAAEADKVDVVVALLACGADRGLRNKQGKTALDIAKSRNDIAKVRLLAL